MSGYLEVKLCSKGNRGLTPWKAWKKQWCILRPSPVKDGELTIVFHTSAGLASNSQIEIPKHSVIYRTDSKTKCYSFGVFPTADSRKPIVLLAGQSESDSQLWIGRMRTLLHGNYKTDKLASNDGFTVSIVDNVFTNSCGLKGVYGNLIITKDGFQIMEPYNKTCRAVVKWDHISDMVLQETEKNVDKNKICIVTTNRDFEFGHGQIHIFCQMGIGLLTSLKNRSPCSPSVVLRKMNRRISRSEGTLLRLPEEDLDVCLDDNQRDSGLSSCCRVSTDEDKSLRISMDDEGLVLKAKKASTLISAGMMLSSQRLLNCKMATQSLERFSHDSVSPLRHITKTTSLTRRCSGTSLASGIYEEISENPPHSTNCLNIVVTSPPRHKYQSDNTYEVLKAGRSSYSPRRYSRYVPPPPLPPRTKRPGRLDSTSDSGLDEESSCSTPHGSEDGKWMSLHGSLPRLTTAKDFDADKTVSHKTSKNYDRLQSAFGVFRKRIKSESQVTQNHHHYHRRDYKLCSESDTVSYLGSEISSKKRLFEFNLTPVKSNHRIKNSKISKALKKLRMNGNLKNSAKSCETLECKEALNDSHDKSITKRCSKSEENLDYRIDSTNGIRNEVCETNRGHLNVSAEWCSDGDENAKDLSLIYTEESIKNSYPKDILELLLKGRMEELQLRLKQRSAEEEYMLMSPCRLNEQSPALQMKTIDKPRCKPISVEDNYVVMKSA